MAVEQTLRCNWPLSGNYRYTIGEKPPQDSPAFILMCISMPIQAAVELVTVLRHSITRMQEEQPDSWRSWRSVPMAEVAIG